MKKARGQGKSGLSSRAAAAVGLARAVARDARTGGLRLRAAALTYVTLLSLAPLLAICFSALKAVGIHNQLKPFLFSFLEPLGRQGRDISLKIVGFVDNIKVGVLGVAGSVILVYGVLTMMKEIEFAFNDIWRVQRGRGFWRRLRTYPAVLLIVPSCMALSVLMTEALRHALLLEDLLGIEIPDSFSKGAAGLAGYALFALAFTALYMIMPNTKVRPLPALAAGVVSAALWKLLGWLFGAFVAGSGSYAAIYSVFAAMMLFMVWLNTGWLIVLTGASIAYHIQHPGGRDGPGGQAALKTAV